MTVQSSIVTFLFTDIEGSTHLWESYPAQMQVALARHDALMRAAIESHRGHVFKTIGDAFCAVFDAGADGIKAATSAQRAIKNEDWPAETPIRVRMALHAGEVESRDNDYFGPTVNRVARLLATAHGGQTIVSKSVVDQAGVELGASVGLLDMGEHRLKDLTRPEYVYQVTHPDLQESFPPLRSLDSGTVPNNLPEQLTTFVGRKKELGEVSALLSRNRIVTLVGSGGCGKTRLAVQVASDNVASFPDGVWLAELASVTDPAMVPQTVASLVGAREDPGQTIMQSLTAHLKRRKTLLVIDNCEHLLMACIQFVDALLRACPDVKILATSREAFNIAGEASFRVPSLSLPDPKLHRDPASVEQFEAVQLFVDRASAIVPDFAPTTQNAQSLAMLCRQLDGIPLAIELAAARVRSLSVEQIATRLDDRFRLLTGGSRTALPRQQTLRALVDWSYDLLGPHEQCLLRRLSIFAGGWTLAAAESVAAGDDIEDWEVLDLLTSLLDKSLVSFDPAQNGGRYRMLETVRQYGREKLVELGEEESIRRKYVEWFASFGPKAATGLRGPEQTSWRAFLEDDQDNLAQALDMARTGADTAASGQLAWTLAVAFQYQGFLNDAIGAVESGLQALSGAEAEWPETWARLTYERAGLHADFGELGEAVPLAHKALEAFEQAKGMQDVARCENLLGQIAMSERDFEAAQGRFEKALALFVKSGDPLGEAVVRNNMGLNLRRRSGHGTEAPEPLRQEAKEALLEALRLRRQFKDLKGESETLNNLGVVSFDSKDYKSAWIYYQQALEIDMKLRRTLGLGRTLANMGEVAGVLGDPALAMKLLALSERILQDLQSPLAGAVRSMLKDTALEAPELDAERLAAEVRSLAVDTAVEMVLITPVPGANS